MKNTMTTESIDIADKQAVEMVLNFLVTVHLALRLYSMIPCFLQKNGFPQSLYMWQFLTHLKNDRITKDSLWPYQLIVDDPAHIECVLFAYSSTGFAHHYKSNVKNSESIPNMVTCYSDEKHDDRLLSLIDRYVLSAKGKSICFSSIEHRLSAKIEQLIAHQRSGTCKSESFHMLELNKQVFEEKHAQKTSSPPSGNTDTFRKPTSQDAVTFLFPLDVVLRPLTVSDATTINDRWTYRSDASLFQIMYEIEHFPSYGKRRTWG